MADNPIKHSDIIQDGNPFEDTIKGLEKLLKLLKETAKEYKKFAEKQNASTKEGRKNLQSAATATQQLSAKEKEAIKIKKQLEREQAKLNLMSSKEYKELIKTKEATVAKNLELKQTAKTMRTGVKSTNTWTKALGSFAFKFNALGNIAANVVSKLTTGLKEFVKGSLKAYDTQIKAEKSLFVAMEGRISATNTLIRQARQLQKMTLFGDEETIKAQALIAAFVDEADAIRKVIPLVQDMAQAKGMDLAGASDLVAKTLGSSTNALSRYGIEVTGAVGSTERLDSLTRGLTEAFGGQAEAAALVDAQFTSLKNTIGDIQESIGGFIADTIFLFQVHTGLLGKNIKPVEELSLEAQQANSKFKELSAEIGGSSDVATAKLAEVLERQKNVKEEYENMVKGFSDLSKKEKEAALIKINNLRSSKAFYAELIPLLEMEIRRIENVEGARLAEEEAYKRKLIEERRRKENEEHAKTLEFLKQINDENGNLQEEDQEAVDLTPYVVGDETRERAKAILDETIRNRNEKLKAQIKKEEEARRKAIEEEEEAEKEKQAKIQATFDLANKLTTTFTNIFAAQKEKELSAAGDNAEKRAEIEKKYAKKEQALAVSQAVVDGAASILKTKASLGLPAAIPFMIADAAITAAQIGVIAAQKFEEGGPVIGQPHSRGGVPIEAEGGEYVINKRSTAKYTDLIQAINAGDQASIANAAMQNAAFHDVWDRTGAKEIAVVSNNDPYIKKLYELMRNTPQVGPYKDRIEIYPNGKRRIING